jgi:peptide/nickel transport system substrate-binding protein
VTSRTASAALATVALAVMGAAGCGRKVPATTTTAAETVGRLSPTTPAAKGDTGPVTWATYRDVGTLDPIQAFDYPENTVITAMCDSLLQQQPDGSSKPGLATKVVTPDPRTIVFTINTGAKFWDGQNVTPADVVYSLKRNTDPKLAGFYGAVFESVDSIEATAGNQVTIKLKQPDNWLLGELSQMPGIVLEKAYVESEGKAFGTPSGGTMCTGPFKLKSWRPGSDLTAVRNGAYWDTSLRPMAASMVFKGAPDESSLTSGLLTNEITGFYPQPLTTLGQLKSSTAVTVHTGPSFASDAFVITSLTGALKDMRVRQALSMAIDRKAYINALYGGYGVLPRTLANPGTWGYERAVFRKDWNRLPEPTQDVAKAKQLVQQAGATGKTIVIGTSSEINPLQIEAEAIRQAALSIGLKAKFKSASAANFINFFTDAAARKGVDGLVSGSYTDYADPAALYKLFAVKGGSLNYDDFEDPRISAALESARRVPDERTRAELTARAGDLIMQTLPWIPLADPDTIVIMDKRITGAPASFQYMGGPWAATIGASG